MTGIYGPNTTLVSAVIERASNLTDDEADLFNAARYAGRYDAQDAACDAAGDAARDSARYDAWDDASDDVWLAGRSAGRFVGRSDVRAASLDAALDAAVALVVCDLVGQYGLEQHHIDTLIGPWAAVCGDPRTTQGETP